MAIGVTRKLEAWLRFGDVGSCCISKLIHLRRERCVGYWYVLGNVLVDLCIQLCRFAYACCSFVVEPSHRRLKVAVLLQFLVTVLQFLSTVFALFGSMCVSDQNIFVFAHMRLSLSSATAAGKYCTSLPFAVHTSQQPCISCNKTHSFTRNCRVVTFPGLPQRCLWARARHSHSRARPTRCGENRDGHSEITDLANPV